MSTELGAARPLSGAERGESGLLCCLSYGGGGGLVESVGVCVCVCVCVSVCVCVCVHLLPRHVGVNQIELKRRFSRGTIEDNKQLSSLTCTHMHTYTHAHGHTHTHTRTQT